MIDLTPLDVRKKSGDFRKVLRGYDPQDVDTFLGLVAERMEELVKETLTLRERAERLQEQVASQEGREKAVQNALVTAQELRDDIRAQAETKAEEVRQAAEREAELVRREAEGEAERIVADARRQLDERRDALQELERKRLRFLKTFRALLERELDMVEVEEGRTPLDEVAVELELGPRRPRTGAGATAATGADQGAPGTPPEAGSPHEEGPPPPEPGTGDFEDEESRPPADAPVHELAAGADLGVPDDPRQWLASFLDEEEELAQPGNEEESGEPGAEVWEESATGSEGPGSGGSRERPPEEGGEEPETPEERWP